MENVRKSEVELCFPLIVPDLSYKFQQMLCLRGAQVNERKPNAGPADISKG